MWKRVIDKIEANLLYLNSHNCLYFIKTYELISNDKSWSIKLN